MRGGPLPAPKARKPARYLTTPLSQIRVGHMVDGVPRALQGPLMQPAAATCFEHQLSNTIAPSAAGIRSAACGAVCFRLTSAEYHGRGAGAPALSVLRDGVDAISRRSAAGATCASLLHLPARCALPPPPANE